MRACSMINKIADFIEKLYIKFHKKNKYLIKFDD